MNLPAHLANRQKRDLVGAAIGGLNAGSPPHISIAGNRFTLVDDAGNQKPMQTLYLDVCVIDANASVSKIYFDPRTPFEPGGDNSNPPICWSDNGIGASAQASQPQNASCRLCPQNAWGSATSKATGKPVKACNDVKKVAVVTAGIEMVFLLRIPPASLKNWGKYCQTLAGHGVDLPDAITRLEFESQGVLKFTPMGYVDAASAAFSDKVMEARGTDQIVGRNDRSWTGQGDVQKIEYAQRAQNATPSLPNAPMQPMTPPPQPFVTNTPRVGDPNDPRREQPFGQQEQNGAANAFATQQAGPHDPFGQPSTSSPTAAIPEVKTRKPRTPKDPQAGAANLVGADDGIPPFLKRDTPPPTTPAPNPTQFGMQQNPAAPDAGVQAALDAAFRLPT